MKKTDRLIIYISGKDQKGIVASVSDYLYRRSFNITELDQFNDPFSENFLMRLEFSSEKSERRSSTLTSSQDRKRTINSI